MSKAFLPDKPRAAPIFKAPATPAPLNPIPSSSPAFATPAHPIRPFNPAAIPQKASILPILLPPATLRPLAFRTFTKKHSLTLTSSALQVLATFIGRHCGTEWREEGLAEKVLEEVAKSWKNRNGGVIVQGEDSGLKDILKNLEGSMSGGRIVAARELSRQNSLVLGSSQNGEVSHTRLGFRPGGLAGLGREDSQSSLGLSNLDVEDDEDDEGVKDPRKWLKVIDAFEQPRLIYNVGKKHFDRDTSKPSLLPQPSHKTQVFRNRYNLIHQRLLRNESFQTPTFETSKASLKRSSSTLATTQQSYKLTPIANLLGRNGSSHMLLGLLTIAPTGTLAINDLTGSIALDLTHAKAIPEDGAWFAPGMIVLVDGTYEEEDSNMGSGLGGSGGIGGTIGGKFIGFFVGGPPCERRQLTLGLGGKNGEGDVTAGGGFGWVDFLGVGSERAVGSKMRKIEQRLIRNPLGEEAGGRGRMVVIGEVNLDQPRTLQALKKLLGLYAAEPEEDTPMTFILMGNFVKHAVMARGGSGGSIEYKEYFDALALTLSEYPTLLQSATFIFVPGDNDGWASSFSAGAATSLPRKGVPEMFTSRIKRAFATANAEADKERGKKSDGEAIWTSNPSRLSLFGPTHEIVLFRDNMTGRLRRTAIKFASSKPETEENGEEDIEMPEPTPEPEQSMDVDSQAQEAESHVPEPETAAAEAVSSDLHVARKLVKTVLDQGYLSPFGMSIRPVLWDYTSALQVYPLPTAMVLADTEAPAFCVTYEGCHVMNPGSVVAPGRRGVARWVEYDVRGKVGKVREVMF
ncbi:DNA polymerase epsilon subunit B [Lachnellula willkommii]|uniref:DNA polymerase epsilon subunit B n=1 Tax=Lachnellula willkommii TaxID=215461 RepID=A0A559MJQ9_9HELO|nr:DNA polymerase epsilon subunit B [Lachnellula willkommii]